MTTIESIERNIQEYLQNKYGRETGFYHPITVTWEEQYPGREESIMIRVKDHNMNTIHNDKPTVSIVVTDENATISRFASDPWQIKVNSNTDLSDAYRQIDDTIEDITVRIFRNTL